MNGPRPPLFDAHLHVIDPRFPLVPNGGYLPPAFTVADYQARTAQLDVVGGAVVSGSFQAFDQTYLLAALAELGPGFVGVTQLPASVPDEQVVALAQAGVRAVRFNVRRGGSETLEHLDRLARRVHDLAGWHTELYVDSVDLPDLLPVLTRLPRVSVDHLGLSRAGLPHLLSLVEHGAHVKATGFSRSDLDVPAALRAVAAANPAALVAGTDLPSTRAPRPFHDHDLDLVLEALGPDLADAAFHRNALTLYQPPSRSVDAQGQGRRT
ncbi:MAG: amidohydrolase family protein [Actinomycetota bacterium]|nr:amidohydrolase family protein [Actinomycetota bacterium]